MGCISLGTVVHLPGCAPWIPLRGVLPGPRPNPVGPTCKKKTQTEKNVLSMAPGTDLAMPEKTFQLLKSVLCYSLFICHSQSQQKPRLEQN